MSIGCGVGWQKSLTTRHGQEAGGAGYQGGSGARNGDSNAPITQEGQSFLGILKEYPPHDGSIIAIILAACVGFLTYSQANTFANSSTSLMLH